MNGFWNSLDLTASRHCLLDMHFQHHPELDSSGRDEGAFCPVLCCPNTATLITVSPSDLTLMFLLGARCLAQSPGLLDEGTAAVSTLLPIVGGWKAGFILRDFHKGFKNAQAWTCSESRCYETGGGQCQMTLPTGFPLESRSISHYFQTLMFFRGEELKTNMKTHSWWRAGLSVPTMSPKGNHSSHLPYARSVCTERRGLFSVLR